MAKAVMMWTLSHRFDPADTSKIEAFITFRFLDAESYLGPIDATATIISTDTSATLTTKIQNAVIAKAADYGITLTEGDLIPLVYGFPKALMSSTSSATVTLSDDGVNLSFYGSLGTLFMSAASASGPILGVDPAASQVRILNRPSGSQFIFDEHNVYGAGDIAILGWPSVGTGYFVIDTQYSLGMVLSTVEATPISIRPNRTQVAYFDGNGLNMAAGAQVKNAAAQSGGKSVTNNVTAGGTADQGDDFTSLTLYASDAAAIRNNIYQLWQKCDRIADGLRTLGLLANS